MRHEQARTLIERKCARLSAKTRMKYEANYVPKRGWQLKWYKYCEDGSYEGCFNGDYGTVDQFLTSGEMVWYLDGILKGME